MTHFNFCSLQVLLVARMTRLLCSKEIIPGGEYWVNSVVRHPLSLLVAKVLYSYSLRLTVQSQGKGLEFHTGYQIVEVIIPMKVLIFSLPRTQPIIITTPTVPGESLYRKTELLVLSKLILVTL